MLEINHVTKTFYPGTVNQRVALDDLSLRVEDEDFITIVGSNGAGKSTLFNTIAGNFAIDQGEIILDGQDITDMPEYKRAKYIGRLFQDPMKGTAPDMTIEENLALAYLRADSRTNPFSRISKADHALFARQLSALGMGLEDRMNQKAGTLSGGQRQALTLLMATIVPPKILLLDEHTAALDPGAAQKILDLTQQIVAEHHITCLMITHNLHQALELGKRTIVMSNGKIRLDLSGPSRSKLSLSDLVKMFNQSDEILDNDRILFS